MTLMAAVDASVKVAGLQDLTIHRSVSSIPFAGRYRLIDFALIKVLQLGRGEGLAEHRHAVLPFFVADHRQSIDIFEMFDVEFNIFPEGTHFPA